MDNYQIRAEAKQLLKNLKGKYVLFAIPILYHLVIVNLSLRNQSELNNMDPAALETMSLFKIWSGPLFVLTISILSSFVMLGVYWTLLKVRRSQQTDTQFKDSLLALSHENFGKSFVTLLAKVVLLIF